VVNLSHCIKYLRSFGEYIPWSKSVMEDWHDVIAFEEIKHNVD